MIRLRPQRRSSRDTLLSVITLVTSICGVVFGFGGLLLSILNYFRDRASAIVTLQWDFRVLDSGNCPTEEPMGVVSIANNGRRPLYIKLVYLKIPKHSLAQTEIQSLSDNALILRKTLQGQKLGEGDPEIVITIGTTVTDWMSQRLASCWEGIYAVATDNCGRQYRSKVPKAKPSWAGGTPVPPDARAH